MDGDGLPPVLASLLKPWATAVTSAGPGMGGHLSATAANAAAGIRRRIVQTPLLDHALLQALGVTDVLAAALDRGSEAPAGPRADASAALAELAAWLCEADPDASTTELGLGW